MTTTRGATNEPMPAMVTTEEVRTVLLTKRPSAADAINAMVITNDNGVITLRGTVEDEATHTDIVNRVRSMPNVRNVRDEIQVMPKSSSTMPMDSSGTGTTSQGQMGGSQTGQGQTGSGMGGSQMGQGTQGQSGSSSTGQGGQMGTGAAAGAAAGGAAGSMTGTMSKSDAVRQSMETARPKSASVIQGLTITDDGSVVTLSGTVPDETTHQALLKAAKATPGVTKVQDDLKVQPKKKTQ